MVPRHASDVDYDTSGVGYERVRRADPRIEAYIREQLGAARTVLNVGAGAGSYEPADRYVIAVEPSAAMRARRTYTHAVPAIDATAAALPLDDNAVDAALAIFTVHQWPDIDAGLHEVRRVTAGPVVVMTLDIDALPGMWLADYLPERVEVERRRFPALVELYRALGGHVTTTRVPIPVDCTDGFLEAYYARPEALLDDAIRAGQSGWQFVDRDITSRALARLHADLRTGRWDRRYGHLRKQLNYVGPLVLVTSSPSTSMRQGARPSTSPATRP